MAINCEIHGYICAHSDRLMYDYFSSIFCPEFVHSLSVILRSYDTRCRRRTYILNIFKLIVVCVFLLYLRSLALCDISLIFVLLRF